MTESFIQLRQAIVNDLDAAFKRELLPQRTYEQILQDVQRFQDRAELFEDDRKDLVRDANLSETGRNEQVEKLFLATEQALSGIVNTLHERLDAVITAERNAATPRLQDVTPEAFEARAANIRSDLRMLLDPLTPNEAVEKLEHLARHGDATMRHHIIASGWTEMYLESRGGDALPIWANRRRALLPLVLDQRGQQAEQRLAAEENLRRVVTTTAFLLDSWLQDHRPRRKLTNR